VYAKSANGGTLASKLPLNLPLFGNNRSTNIAALIYLSCRQDDGCLGSRNSRMATTP
jgi:hypothetical protein